jgi:predicted phosphodiesterase
MKIYSISDLHVDYRPNLDWVMNLSQQDYRDDVLIVAGDLSDKLDRVEQCFRHLSACFKQVLYVPGNHDLWLGKNDGGTSLDKFNTLMAMAEGYNILTKPYHADKLTIVPMFGWYDFSFGPCCEYLQERWMDFFMCRWGEGFAHLPDYSTKEQAITDYFHSLNEPYLGLHNETVISFSHFMPRIDVMPDYIPAIHQKLYPILGSRQLDKQVRALGSSLHVYGHSHVNRHELIEGVSYINNAFGNPGEERIAKKRLQCVLEITP